MKIAYFVEMSVSDEDGGAGRFNKLPPGQLESPQLRKDNAVTYLKRSGAQKVKGAKVEKDLKYC